MSQTEPSGPSWQTAMILVAGIAIVVLIAFLLAEIDSYQQQSAVAPNDLPIIDLEATVAAGELSTIYLPSDISTTPATLAPTAQATATAEESKPPNRVTEIEADCNNPPDGWIPYVVEAGDSIGSLADLHGVSDILIRDANCLPYSHVVEGQLILLPQNPNLDAFAADCHAPPGWIPYRVRPGDTLPKLARKHGTNVYQLMKSNCLKQPNLMPGHEILLPGSPQGAPGPGGGSASPLTWPESTVQSATPSWPIPTPTVPPTP